MIDQEDHEPGDPADNTAMHLSWEQVELARKNEKLQRKGWKRFRPVKYDSARGCPECERPASALDWIYFSTWSQATTADCWVEGWIVACPRCRKQTDFFPTLMS